MIEISIEIFIGLNMSFMRGVNAALKLPLKLNQILNTIIL